MIATLTNVSGRTINALDTITGGSGPAAVNASGGARKDPLCYPWDLIGSLANSGTKVLAVHPRDFRHSAPWSGFDAGMEMQQLIQAGVVTCTYAAQTGVRDNEEIYVDLV